jgi:hypothetical protein
VVFVAKRLTLVVATPVTLFVVGLSTKCGSLPDGLISLPPE